MYDLTPRFSNVKSFYGKAKIEKTENKNICDEKLYSYNTLVARYTKIGNIRQYHYFGQYSCTTTRHQKEFFMQHGLLEKEIKILFKNGYLERGF